MPRRYEASRVHGQLGGKGNRASMVCRRKSFAVVFFCGIGGTILGAQQCGVDVLLAVDICPKALLVCSDSFGVPTLYLDLLNDGVSLTCERIMHALAHRLPDPEDWEYDLFFQWSPECQKASKASPNRCPEEVIEVMKQMVQLEAELSKHVTLTGSWWEMVAGPTIKEWMVAAGSGYGMEAVVVKSQDYGVPQRRERCIWFTGHRGRGEGAGEVKAHLQRYIRHIITADVVLNVGRNMTFVSNSSRTSSIPARSVGYTVTSNPWYIGDEDGNKVATLNADQMLLLQNGDPSKFDLNHMTLTEQRKAIGNMVPVALAVACWRALRFGGGEDPTYGTVHKPLYLHPIPLAHGSLCTASNCSELAVRAHRGLQRCRRHLKKCRKTPSLKQGRGKMESDSCFLCGSAEVEDEDEVLEFSELDNDARRARELYVHQPRKIVCGGHKCIQVMCEYCLYHTHVNAADYLTPSVRNKWYCHECTF